MLGGTVIPEDPSPAEAHRTGTYGHREGPTQEKVYVQWFSYKLAMWQEFIFQNIRSLSDMWNHCFLTVRQTESSAETHTHTHSSH